MSTKPRRKRFPDLELGAQLNEARSRITELETTRTSAAAVIADLKKKVESLHNENDRLRSRGDSIQQALLVSLQAGEALARAWREVMTDRRDLVYTVASHRKET